MGKVSRASFLTAAAVVAAKLPTAPITIIELSVDGQLYVRGMTGYERDAFEDDLRIKKGRRKGEADLTNFRAKLAVRCLVDEDGARVLEDGDADLLGSLPAAVLDRIMAAINKLSATTEEDAADLGNGSASHAASADPSLSSASDSAS